MYSKIIYRIKTYQIEKERKKTRGDQFAMHTMLRYKMTMGTRGKLVYLPKS